MSGMDHTNQQLIVASQFFTLANFYLTTWEEYHTGVSGEPHGHHIHNDAMLILILPAQTLYLSAFSGPVEGILMVCVIYFITGYYGAR